MFKKRENELTLTRQPKPESFFRPKYEKWAKCLQDGEPLRLETTYARTVCFIPSAIFKADKAFSKSNSIIVCFGGELCRGYVELDGNKAPNAFYLMKKGFPIGLGVLICQTIYGMFPHLNPLTDEDKEFLRNRNGQRATTKLLLATTKTKTTRKKKKTESEIPDKEQTTKTEKQDHGNTTTKQRRGKDTLAETIPVFDTEVVSPEEKCPDVQGGGRNGDSGQGDSGSSEQGSILGKSAEVLP